MKKKVTKKKVKKSDKDDGVIIRLRDVKKHYHMGDHIGNSCDTQLVLPILDTQIYVEF